MTHTISLPPSLPPPHPPSLPPSLSGRDSRVYLSSPTILLRSCTIFNEGIRASGLANARPSIASRIGTSKMGQPYGCSKLVHGDPPQRGGPFHMGVARVAPLATPSRCDPLRDDSDERRDRHLRGKQSETARAAVGNAARLISFRLCEHCAKSGLRFWNSHHRFTITLGHAQWITALVPASSI